MLVRMRLAGIPVADSAVAELAWMVRSAGADEFADRLERGFADGVGLLALTIDERAIMNEHQRRQREGLDSQSPERRSPAANRPIGP